MTANPADDPSPDDPVEILSLLPAAYRAQFLAEYEIAVEGARRPEQFRRLHQMLRLWQLRAVAYSEPGYGDRKDGASDRVDLIPAEQLIPGWPGR